MLISVTLTIKDSPRGGGLVLLFCFCSLARLIPNGLPVADNPVLVVNVIGAVIEVEDCAALHTAELRDILVVTDFLQDGRVRKLPVQGMDMRLYGISHKHTPSTARNQAEYLLRERNDNAPGEGQEAVGALRGVVAFQ